MILVVDDHEDIRIVVTRILAMKGYQATSVASGEDALDYLKSAAPHCVLLDYNMPGLNGLSVLAEIKADERLRETKVVMFTGADNDLRQTCLSAGADGFFQKGADLKELTTIVAQFCEAKA